MLLEEGVAHKLKLLAIKQEQGNTFLSGITAKHLYERTVNEDKTWLEYWYV